MFRFGKFMLFVVALLAISSCESRGNWLKGTRDDPLFDLAMDEFRRLKPDLVRAYGSNISGIVIQGRQYDCVLFLDDGTSVIDEPSDMICFNKSTGQSLGLM